MEERRGRRKDGSEKRRGQRNERRSGVVDRWEEIG